MDKRPSLTEDRWVADGEPEFVQVRSGAINEIARASRGIAGIGRILHNSIGDDFDGVSRSSVDNLTKQNLAGAVECLTDYIYDIVEDINATAARLAELNSGGNHE